MISSLLQRRHFVRVVSLVWMVVLLLLPPLARAKATTTSTGVTMASTTAATTAAAATTTAAATTIPSSSTVMLKHQTDRTFTRIAAGKLSKSLGQQIADTAYRTPTAHVHRAFLRQTFGSTSSGVLSNRPQPGTLAHLLRVGLAGGIAGATGTLALFPVDAAKTLRQASPSLYKNVRQAFVSLVMEDGKWHLGRAYCGCLPATLGAIPSSALYFGAYEGVKPLIRKASWADPSRPSGRFWIHSLSAMAGNVLSRCVSVVERCDQVPRNNDFCFGYHTKIRRQSFRRIIF